MNQEKNEERIDLDRMLAEMAQETPEMPSDFHARWTEAVRAEAGQAKTEKKQDSHRQWRYILSAAAVFVFLIGGTLLTRGMDQKDARSNQAAVSTAAPSIAPQPAAAAAAGNSLQGTEGDTASEADLFMAMNEAAEKAEEDAAPAADPAEPLAGMLSANGGKTEEAAAKRKPAAEPETAMEAAEEETIAEDAGLFAEEAAPETAAEPEAAAPEENAENSQESGFVSFLKDLGSFTLKTLAVAVPAAALAFGAAAIHKALKKRKKP